MNKIKSFISVIVGVVAILAATWIVASFIDVNKCNDPFSENYQQFASWNLFV